VAWDALFSTADDGGADDDDGGVEIHVSGFYSRLHSGVTWSQMRDEVSPPPGQYFNHLPGSETHHDDGQEPTGALVYPWKCGAGNGHTRLISAVETTARTISSSSWRISNARMTKRIGTVTVIPTHSKSTGKHPSPRPNDAAATEGSTAYDLRSNTSLPQTICTRYPRVPASSYLPPTAYRTSVGHCWRWETMMTTVENWPMGWCMRATSMSASWGI